MFHYIYIKIEKIQGLKKSAKCCKDCIESNLKFDQVKDNCRIVDVLSHCIVINKIIEYN